MPFVKGQKPPKKGQKLATVAPIVPTDFDLIKDLGLEGDATMPAPEVVAQPKIQEQPIMPPGLDDFYRMTVDYITTPSGVPLSGADNGTISRSALYEAGVNIEAQLAMQSIVFIGRMEA